MPPNGCFPDNTRQVPSSASRPRCLHRNLHRLKNVHEAQRRRKVFGKETLTPSELYHLQLQPHPVQLFVYNSALFAHWPFPTVCEAKISQADISEYQILV